MKILTNGDIQQSYIKLLLKHFMPSWQIEVSLFLSSPFQTFDKDPDKWWLTTIVSYTKLLLKYFTPFRQLEVSFSCHLHFNFSMRIQTNDDIQQSYIKVLLKHFTTFRHIEVSLFLSSPLLKVDEDPDNWWYTTIIFKDFTETLHAISTNWSVAFPVISISNMRWRSWQMRQMMINNNRI